MIDTDDVIAAALLRVGRTGDRLVAELLIAVRKLKEELEQVSAKDAELMFQAAGYRYLRDTTKAVRSDDGNERIEVTPETFDEVVRAAMAKGVQS